MMAMRGLLLRSTRPGLTHSGTEGAPRPRVRGRGRPVSRCVALVLVAAAIVSLLAGCGGPKSIAGNSPEATAQGFVDAMAAGDYDLAATGFDYEQYARGANPDWDAFAPQQRKEIVDRLQEVKASELQALSGMLSGGAQVGSAQTQGTQATVPVTAGATTMQLHMIQQDEQWYIQRIQEGAGG